MLKLCNTIVENGKNNRNKKMNTFKVKNKVYFANTVDYEGSKLKYGKIYTVKKVNLTTIELEEVTGKYMKSRFLTAAKWDHWNSSDNKALRKSIYIAPGGPVKYITEKGKEVNTYMYDNGSFGMYLRDISLNGRWEDSKDIIHPLLVETIKLEVIDLKIPKCAFDIVRIATEEEIALRLKVKKMSIETTGTYYNHRDGLRSMTKAQLQVHRENMGELDLMHTVKIKLYHNNFDSKNFMAVGLRGLNMPNGYIDKTLLTVIKKAEDRAEEVKAYTESKKTSKKRKLYFPKLEDAVLFKKPRMNFTVDKEYIVKNMTSIKSSKSIILKLTNDNKKNEYVDIRDLYPSDMSKRKEVTQSITYKVKDDEKASMIDAHIYRHLVNKDKGKLPSSLEQTFTYDEYSTLVEKLTLDWNKLYRKEVVELTEDRVIAGNDSEHVEVRWTTTTNGLEGEIVAPPVEEGIADGLRQAMENARAAVADARLGRRPTRRVNPFEEF